MIRFEAMQFFVECINSFSVTDLKKPNLLKHHNLPSIRYFIKDKEYYVFFNFMTQTRQNYKDKIISFLSF